MSESNSIRVASYPTLAKMEGFLSGIVPHEMCAKRLIRLFYVELAKSPNLNKCSVDSICGAIMSCAQHGLEPGISGMVYLIPRGGKMSLMLGYRGMIELSYRSGKISNIESYTVYKNDDFKLKMGTNASIEHERTMDVDPGPAIAFYAIVTMKDGTKQFNCMSKGEVEAVRKRSSSPNSGPWVTDYEQMAQKTVIRRLLKLAPTSVSLNAAISLDEASEYDGQNMETIGRAAMLEAGIESDPKDNVVGFSSQSDKLAEKLSGS